MPTRWRSRVDDLISLDSSEVRVLSLSEERELLGLLAECKRKLADAMARIEGPDAIAGGDEPLPRPSGSRPSTPEMDRPRRSGTVFRRYSELRSKLALANMRLVAHVAKQFRDRGIAYSDLLQEGFCGLLEAIDRFDLSHGTKLATYATWWVRQAMQRRLPPVPTRSDSAHGI